MKKLIKELSPFNNIESNNMITYTIKILIKALLVYIVSLIVAEAFVIGLHYPLGYDPFGNPMPVDIMLLFKYYGYIVTIILFFIFAKKIEKIKLKEIGINSNIKKFFIGMIIGIITLLSIIVILMIIGKIKYNGINKDINYSMIALFMGGFLVQSAMEEIICRGYLLNKLKNKLPLFIAIFISFIFFSVFHFFELFNDGILLGIIGVINLFLISIIWSILSLKDKNIYSAIGFHFIWNFALFNIIGLNLSGLEAKNSVLNFTSNNSFISGMSYGIESSIITTLILLVALIIISLKKNK